MRILTPEPRDGFNSVVFAKDQPEYIPLPANVDGRMVETKWGLTWRERLSVLCRGSVYLTVMSFGHPLQPLRMSVTRERDLYRGDDVQLLRARLHDARVKGFDAIISLKRKLMEAGSCRKI
jgi:hypothetical protein